MPKGTLVGIRAKLKWADAHLDQLKADFKASAPIGGNTVMFHYDVNGLAASTNIALPLVEWSIMAGNVAHQIRSCLDHVVYQLALQHPRKVKAWIKSQGSQGRRKLSRVLHYPIYESANDFSANWKVVALKKILTAREFAAIENTQPYKRNSLAPRSEYLFILNALDNIDKHRTLFVIDKRASARFDVHDGPSRYQVQTPANVVKPGAPLFRVPIGMSRPLPRVKINDVSIYITFSDTDGLCDNDAVIDTLRHIRRHVESLIDTKFARFFP